MITPALVILLMVIGWSAAAVAMLWGMLRIARHHHKPRLEARQERPKERSGPAPAAQPLPVSLTA